MMTWTRRNPATSLMIVTRGPSDSSAKRKGAAAPRVAPSKRARGKRVEVEYEVEGEAAKETASDW